jgi:hypothetical protein
LATPVTPPKDATEYQQLKIGIVQTAMEKATFQIPDYLEHILRKPVRGLSTRDFWQRLLPVADGGAAWREVWAAVEANIQTEDRQARGIVLVTGVSGVGKTKAAHDIGMQCALVVLASASAFDVMTTPYNALMDKLRSAQMPTPGQNNQAVAMFCHLLISYVEWVADVIETAVNQGCSVDDLPATVLLAQNTRTADYAVTYLFKQSMESSDLTYSAARARLNNAAARCKRHWKEQPILMCHDEVQAILTRNEAFRQLFDDKAGSPDGRVRGLFYGFTRALRELLVGASIEHMMCGTNFRLTEHLSNEFSPTQGRAKHVALATSLSKEQILSWFREHLTPEAANALDEDTVALLRGRPIFAAGFFTELVKDRSGSTDAAEAVVSALRKASSSAQTAAANNVWKLWNRGDTALLVAELYVALKTGLGTKFQYSSAVQSIVMETVLAGVLNVPIASLANAQETGVIDLRAEPLTAFAVCQVGDTATVAAAEWKLDKAAQAIGRAWNGPAGCRSAKGEVL